jgi:RNA polymerase sigma factor (sigma-70 family)
MPDGFTHAPGPRRTGQGPTKSEGMAGAPHHSGKERPPRRRPLVELAWTPTSSAVRCGGGERAFTEIVNSISDRFLGVAYRILRDTSVAEDAVQQALLSAWQDLPDLRDPAKFEGWSYRLLVHACYMEARKRKRWHPKTVVRSLTEPTAPDLIGGVIERERLERGFARLSVDHRTVLVLTYYMDLPSEQVAEALDVPVGTVYSRLHRAQQALRGALEADVRVPQSPAPSQAIE